jgi:hypothetical protein
MLSVIMFFYREAGHEFFNRQFAKKFVLTGLPARHTITTEIA